MLCRVVGAVGAKDFTVVIKEGPRQLFDVAVRFARKVTAQNGRLETLPPDARARKLADAATFQFKFPVELQFRVRYAWNVIEVVFREQRRGILFAAGMDQHNPHPGRFDLLACSLQLSENFPAERST